MFSASRGLRAAKLLWCIRQMLPPSRSICGFALDGVISYTASNSATAGPIDHRALQAFWNFVVRDFQDQPPPHNPCRSARANQHRIPRVRNFSCTFLLWNLSRKRTFGMRQACRTDRHVEQRLLSSMFFSRSASVVQPLIGSFRRRAPTSVRTCRPQEN